MSDRARRIADALDALDAAGRRDPRIVLYAGTAWPREFLHASRVFHWVTTLNPAAPDTLRLAARCHTLARWEVPRDSFPRDRAGYHKWRKATANHSALKADEILKRHGLDDPTRLAASELILKTHFPADPDAQTLEDADCLAFIETKFDAYIPQWDESKTIRILRGTLKKMSPDAAKLALALPLSPTARTLIEKAM